MNIDKVKSTIDKNLKRLLTQYVIYIDFDRSDHCNIAQEYVSEKYPYLICKEFHHTFFYTITLARSYDDADNLERLKTDVRQIKEANQKKQDEIEREQRRKKYEKENIKQSVREYYKIQERFKKDMDELYNLNSVKVSNRFQALENLE